MSLDAPFWLNTWLIFSSYAYFVQTLPTGKTVIPYDVFFPPENETESLPPIIMLHGLTDWRKTWLKIAPEIAKNTGRKVYTYDAINHGENEWTDKIDFDVLVSELDTFMQQFNISKATIVGHSMGGKTAIIFALKKPEKVEKLIIEDISPRKPNSKELRFLRMSIRILKLVATEIEEEKDILTAKKLLCDFIGKHILQAQIDEEFIDFFKEWLPLTRRGNKTEWLSNLDLIIKFGDTTTPDDWEPDKSGVFDGEVLFIYGSKSVFEVNTDKTIMKHFPEARLLEIEGAMHNLHFQFPKEFERHVINFINEQLSAK